MYGEVCGDGTSHSRIRAVCVPRVEEHDVDVCFHARPSTWQCGTLTVVFGSVCVCVCVCVCKVVTRQILYELMRI